MSVGLRGFMEQVLAIRAPYNDIMANGVPGMGVTNTSADAVNTMRASASEFAKAYASRSADEGHLQGLADKLEADLMVLATLGVVDDGQTDTIIGQLQELLQKNV